MTLRYSTFLLSAVLFFILTGMDSVSPVVASTPAPRDEAKQVPHGGGTAADELAGLETRRRQLAEKEAALAVKEQELKKLSATLDARLAEINTAKKALDESVKAKRQEMDERYKKMLKIYKGLKPEEAGKLMEKLDEDTAIGMLNQMDQKTAIKLIPFLSQPRVIKWSRLNLVR